MLGKPDSQLQGLNAFAQNIFENCWVVGIIHFPVSPDAVVNAHGDPAAMFYKIPLMVRKGKDGQ